MAMEMNSVERVKRTLAGEPVDRTPVVPLMIHHCVKLAGLTLGRCARDPALLVTAHVKAWETYGYDGFHVSCDNWVLPSALGCKIQFFDDQPPTAMNKVLAESKELSLLTRPVTGTEGRLGFKVQATRLAAEAVGDRCFLMTCFDQGPFSLATAMRGIETLMLDCYDDPQFVFDLLDICTDAVIKFARACGQAGCHALTFGESTSGLLNRDLYERFALPYEKRVIAALADLDIPVFLHICGNTEHVVDLMATTGAAGLEVDYQHDIAFYREKVGNQICLKGNIEPSGVLYQGTPEQVKASCRKAIEQSRGVGRLILSSGCEVPRDTPPANLRALVASAREFS
jgi:uroporphyrinogen decarboxylase